MIYDASLMPRRVRKISGLSLYGFRREGGMISVRVE